MSALHSTFPPKWSENTPDTFIWLPLLCSLLSVLTIGTYLLKYIRRNVSETGWAGEWPEWQKQMSSDLNNVDHFIPLWVLPTPPSSALPHHDHKQPSLIIIAKFDSLQISSLLNFRWGKDTQTHLCFLLPHILAFKAIFSQSNSFLFILIAFFLAVVKLSREGTASIYYIGNGGELFPRGLLHWSKGGKSLEVLEFLKWNNLQLIKYLDISEAPKWVTYHYLQANQLS